MDNVEITDEVKLLLREEQTKLINLIEALANLDGTKEWETVRELTFEKSLKAIERQLLNEALAVEVNMNKIYRLQGEWVWAKQYSDVKRFVDTLKKQLEAINLKLK